MWHRLQVVVAPESETLSCTECWNCFCFLSQRQATVLLLFLLLLLFVSICERDGMRRTVEIDPLHAAPPPFSKGGFSGTQSNVITLGSTVSARERKARADQRDFRAATLADKNLVKLASVRLEGWEREKEVRVRNAFDRIVDHGWYDNAESTLKVMELGHINAVREHYAMRRDKIKTPALISGPKTNSCHALEWVDNVNAIDDLSKTTHLQNHFMGLMRQKVAARQRRQQQEQK